jgi:hypothetical protein
MGKTEKIKETRRRLRLGRSERGKSEEKETGGKK